MFITTRKKSAFNTRIHKLFRMKIDSIMHSTVAMWRRQAVKCSQWSEKNIEVELVCSCLKILRNIILLSVGQCL